MDAWIYQAALLCDRCAQARMCALGPKGDREDSDDYPQGPYPNGGGEADTPQHCDACGVFLENGLTCDGDDYVKEQIIDYLQCAKRGRLNWVEEMVDFYGIDISDLIKHSVARTPSA